ncbi:allophanate hydrolase [Saccharopolyspora sp. NPDC049357]|uniref:5-oxoprolinase subunit C family protein n=1 Tax=Saccharopolyspora sp. NPDC049357 TaxID=3154507 RepID=UPI00342BC9C7
MTKVSVEITGTGWLTTFQDLGRRDSERLGVPTGGAADQHSAAVANLLAGNPRHATLLENLGGDLTLIPEREILIAVTGAPARVTVGGSLVDSWSPIVVPAGLEIRVSDVQLGLRTYLAINGAIAAETFLSSAAPDARMGFSQVLTPGAGLLVETEFRGFRRASLGGALFRLPVPVARFAEGPWEIDVVETSGTCAIPGIRELIAESTYVVTGRSNHVGLRLDGPVRHPGDDTEIVSHGVPIGALEIPHADELIVLGRYRTLTAGYPIVGVAARSCLPLLGQAGPGRELRFRWIERSSAVERAAQRERELRALENAVAEAFGALGFPGHSRSSS